MEDYVKREKIRNIGAVVGYIGRCECIGYVVKKEISGILIAEIRKLLVEEEKELTPAEYLIKMMGL